MLNLHMFHWTKPDPCRAKWFLLYRAMRCPNTQRKSRALRRQKGVVSWCFTLIFAWVIRFLNPGSSLPQSQQIPVGETLHMYNMPQLLGLVARQSWDENSPLSLTWNTYHCRPKPTCPDVSLRHVQCPETQRFSISQRKKKEILSSKNMFILCGICLKTS